MLSYHRLRCVPARPLMAAMAAILMFATGSLALVREAVSDYAMFSREDVALAEYVKETTPRNSRFVTGFQHINPVSSLAGREIVAGPDLWLHFHGFDTRERQEAILAFYRDPAANRDVPARYGADYVLLGPQERALGGNQQALSALYEIIYDAGGYTLYLVQGG